MEIRAFEPADEPAVVALWERCGLTRPWMFLVGVIDGQVAAVVMAGYEGHRGAINSLGWRRSTAGKGWGGR